MVEYMKSFLRPFQVAPYTIETIGGSQRRITNTFSGFSAVVRGYRGEVFERVTNLDDEGQEPYYWKPVSAERLREKLGICEERG